MIAKNSSGTTNNSNGNRSVTATSCARKTSNETIIKSDLNAEISIYPNPAINEVTIEINNIQNKNVNLDIFDISGKLIQNVKLNAKEDLINQQLNISQFVSGIYFMNFTIDNKEYLKKIIKN